METLIGAQQIAEYLGIGRTTFTQMKDVYHIPYYRVGKKILAKREMLDAWILAGGTREEASE